MTRLPSCIVAALLVLAVLQIMFPLRHAAPVMAGLLICFLMATALRLSWHTKVLCGGLATVAVLLASTFEQWPALFEGITKATIYPAFLSTIVLLRAAADQRPEITAARKMFSALDPTARDSGIVIGTHLLASILQVGVFAILAPILGRDASIEERRQVFTVAIRGMATVPFWSPFVVGMAVGSQYIPSVPLWQIMALGILLSALSIMISILAFDRNPGINSLAHALGSLAPIALPIFLAALVVVGTTVATGLSTLQALIISLPIPCLFAIWQSPAGNVGRAILQTATGIGRIGPETSILVCATMLVAVFEAALPSMGLVDWLKALAPPSAVIIFAVILTMNIAGLLGIHPIVSGTFVLVIFTSFQTGLSDLVLLQSMLVGWGLCSMISIGSLSIATGATMFQIPPTALVMRANIAYVFVTSAIVGAILSGLNELL